MEDYTNVEERRSRRANKKKEKKPAVVIARLLLVVFTTLLAVVLALLIVFSTIFNGPSPSARDTLVTTLLESGNLKFVVSLFFKEDEVMEIVNKTSMKEMNASLDTDLIASDGEVEGDFDENGIQIVEVNGRSFYGTMMIVKDASKVKCGTTYPWGEYGKELDKLVSENGAVAGVNGGLYAADGNRGGRPYGVCVSNGEILLNDPSGWPGTYMIGLDNNNILRIQNVAGWNGAKFKEFVAAEGIRDAVAFQDEASDSNNHFVPLIINGEARELNGAGCGANPRTAIGQRADGAILLLVTDGRGAAGHLGATASDLIGVMQQFGAVNAANLDGGSSSSMVYKGEYLMTSVTLYYANSSWKLPTAFVVMGGGQ
ncbi:MAG: phosphodiester glycosidase family protein [Clostridia bacterium]|nr:phosphodiester glycosidase family protein [Clostridia bacterium]